MSDYNFEFQDVNEDYEGLSKINKLTELRYIASSLQDDQSSVQDEDLMLSDRYVDVGRKAEPSPNLMPSQTESPQNVIERQNMNAIVRLNEIMDLKTTEES